MWSLWCAWFLQRSVCVGLLHLLCRGAGEVAVGSSVTHLARHAHSALAAMACDDLSVRVFDVEVLSHCLSTSLHPHVTISFVLQSSSVTAPGAYAALLPCCQVL